MLDSKIYIFNGDTKENNVNPLLWNIILCYGNIQIKNSFCVIVPLQNNCLEILVKYIYEQDVVNAVKTHLIQKP